MFQRLFYPSLSRRLDDPIANRIRPELSRRPCMACNGMFQPRVLHRRDMSKLFCAARHRPGTVSRWRLLTVSRLPRGKADAILNKPPRPCASCGKPFAPSKRRTRLCARCFYGHTESGFDL